MSLVDLDSLKLEPGLLDGLLETSTRVVRGLLRGLGERGPLDYLINFLGKLVEYVSL